ncbi:unnamed protein product [Schistosoma haematobium]|nr:unnamed protein product [Schistosoma haematobium]
MQSASSYWEKTLKVKIDSEKPVYLPRECSNKGHFVEIKKNIPYCRNSICNYHTFIQGAEIPVKYLSSCYHKKYGQYRKVYSEGSGIAPNQLLIILTDSSRTPRDECSNIHAAHVATHPSTGRPFMGVLNYCLPEKESITISDDKLINVIKRELADVLNDLMTPYLLETSSVSRITLAYFEDIKGQDIEPYCDIPNEPKCAGYENAVGICSLFQHENQLDEKYQYMDNFFPFNDTQKEKYGGHMAFDYCPVLLVQSDEHYKPNLCEQESEIKPDSISNMFMEYRGPNSGCFNDQKQTYVNISGTYTDKKKPSCHKFQCSKNTGVLVIFNEKAFQCPVEGGPLHIEQQVRNGNVLIDIQCPKCRSLCKVTSTTTSTDESLSIKR